MVFEFHKQGTLIGVTRQPIIEVWLRARIKTESSNLSVQAVGR